MRKGIGVRWPSLSTQNFTQVMSFPWRGCWRTSGGGPPCDENREVQGSTPAAAACPWAVEHAQEAWLSVGVGERGLAFGSEAWLLCHHRNRASPFALAWMLLLLGRSLSITSSPRLRCCLAWMCPIHTTHIRTHDTRYLSHSLLTARRGACVSGPVPSCLSHLITLARSAVSHIIVILSRSLYPIALEMLGGGRSVHRTHTLRATRRLRVPPAHTRQRAAQHAAVCVCVCTTRMLVGLTHGTVIGSSATVYLSPIPPINPGLQIVDGP